MALYDSANIFAKILRGDAPCTKIYEDDVALAFMDIMPRADGHALVIPKFAARNLFDMPSDALGPYMRSVQKVAIAAVKAMSADGLTVQQFNESAGGQLVFHLHFHLLPRWSDTPLRPAGVMGDREKIAAHAALIRAAF